MTIWLERKEKMTQFDAIVKWRLLRRPPPLSKPPTVHHAHVQMTRELVAWLTFDKLVSRYGAKDFYNALATFLTHHESQNVSRQTLCSIISRFRFTFNHVYIFHKIRL
jgi:hypothetical protein